MNPSLSTRAARGSLLLILQALFGKGITLASQLVLARLLGPEDWGVYALALSIATIASVIAQLGLINVLVQRGRKIYLWTSTATTISIGAGCLTGCLVYVSQVLFQIEAPAGTLQIVFGILALDVAINAMLVLPIALLRTELAFGQIAAAAALGVCTTAITAIACATIEMGPAALAIGKLFGTAVQALWLVRASGYRLRPVWRYRRMIALLRPGSIVAIAALAFAITQQADYIIVSLFDGPMQLGYYFLAFTISTQIAALLAGNVQTVLLPLLVRSKDLDEQFRQIRRVVSVLCIVVFPIASCMSLTSQSIIVMLFGARWEGSGPLMQFLCLSAALRIVTGPVAVLLQAQAHFKLYLVAHLISAIVFLVIVTTVTAYYGVIGTAISVFMHSIFALVLFIVVTARHNPSITALGRTIAIPVLSALVAAVPAVLLKWIFEWSVLGSTFLNHLVAFITLTAAYLAVYGLIIGLAAKADVQDLFAIIRAVLFGKSSERHR